MRFSFDTAEQRREHALPEAAYLTASGVEPASKDAPVPEHARAQQAPQPSTMPPMGLGQWAPQGQAAEPQAPAQPQESGWQQFARIAGGVGNVLQGASAGMRGETPWFLLQRQQEQQAQLGKDKLELQRQDLAQRRAQLEQQIQDRHMTMVTSILDKGGPNAIAQLEELGKNFSPAAHLAKAAKDSDIAEFNDYVKRGLVSDDMIKRFASGDMTPAHIRVELDTLRDQQKAMIKSEVEARNLQQAKDTPAKKRTPYQNDILAKAEKADLENQRLRKEISQPASPKPTDTEARIAQSLFPGSGSFQELTGNVTKDDSTRIKKQLGVDIPEGTDKKAAVELYMKNRDIQVAGAKATAAELGRQETPASVQNRSNLFNRDQLLKGNLVQAPAGSTESQLRKGDYVELTDQQRTAWAKIQAAKGDAKVMFDLLEPMITATTVPEALARAGKLQYEGYVTGRNPNVRTFNDLKEAFASVVARFVEVGVLTNQDVIRWKNALPGLTETKQSLQTKRQTLEKLYNVAFSALQETLAGSSPEAVQGKYKGKINDLLSKAEKGTTPEQLNADFDVLTGKH